MSEHAVVVDIRRPGITPEALEALEARLIEAVAAAEAGEVDGYELAVSGEHAILYLYGPDADALFAAVEGLLRADDLGRHGAATLRYGEPDEPGVRTRDVALSAPA